MDLIDNKKIELFLDENISKALNVNDNQQLKYLEEEYVNFKKFIDAPSYFFVIQLFKTKKFEIIYMSDGYKEVTGLDNYHENGTDICHRFLEKGSQGAYIDTIREVKEKKIVVFKKMNFNPPNGNVITLQTATKTLRVKHKRYFFGIIYKTNDEFINSKNVNLSLSKHSSNLTKTLFLKLPISVVVTNVLGQILYVNPFFEKLTLFKKHEVINKNPRVLNSGKTPISVFKNLWTTISRGKSWEGYFINVKKNKEIYYEKAVIFPQISSDGRIVKYVALKTDITKEVSFKNKLTKNYSIFHTLINRSNIAYAIIDRNNNLKAFNSSFTSLFNIDENVIIEKNITKINSENKDLLKEVVKRAFKSGRHQEIFFAKHLKIWSEIYAEKISEKTILLSTKDITFLKKTEQKLVLRTNQLTNLIDILQIAIFSLDLDGNIKNLNNKALTLSEGNNITKGQNLLNYFITSNGKKDIIMGEMLINDVFEKETFFNTGTKTLKKVSVSTTFSYDTHLKENLILCIVNDVTKSHYEKEDLEAKVFEKTKKLQIALSKEKELNELKSDFVSKTSHEFRTPLATISITSEFLKKYKNKLTTEKLENKLDKIIEQTQKMISLLDDFLMVEKFNSHRVIFNPKKTSIVQFIENIVNQRLEISKDFEITLTKPSTEIYVLLDEKLGTSIFQNLVSNAVKYSLKLKKVEVEIKIEELEVVVSVKDYGIGIPEDFKDKIFTPFVRAENAAAHDGTGLGLSIVKSSVKMHNGQISFSSSENNGTTFFVRLPIIE
ncbi:MAG: PAS domain S-box protein [Bacteroidales bacterium]|nr:PAS domain S-box protein [Bacteroidales bacterium]